MELRHRGNSNDGTDDTRESDDGLQMGDEDDTPRCRICYETDADGADGVLFRPCLCKGTMSYVHVGCLEKWASIKPSSILFKFFATIQTPPFLVLIQMSHASPLIDSH